MTEPISPTETVSKFQSSFKENKQGFGVRRKANYLSPTLDLSNYKGLLALGYKNISLNLSKSEKDLDFYGEITQECRKLDPNFEIVKDKGNCFKLISESIKKAVELILTEGQKDMRQEVAKAIHEKNQIFKELAQIKSKFAEVSEKEAKLNLREEKIKNEETRILTERKLLQGEKSHMNSTKKYYLQLESELKNLRSDLKSQQKIKNSESSKMQALEKEVEEMHIQVLEQSEKNILEQIRLNNYASELNSEKLRLELEIHNFEENKKKLEEEKISLEKEKKLISEQIFTNFDLDHQIQEDLKELAEKKLELSQLEQNLKAEKIEYSVKRQKLEIDSEKLEKEKEFLKENQEKIRKQAEELQNERNFFESEHKFLVQSQEKVSKLESDLLEKGEILKKKEICIEEEQLALEDAWKNIENIGAFKPKDADLERMFRELHAQIDNYNKEVSEKEAYFQDLNETLYKKEKAIEAKVTELKRVEKDLKNSQLEINLINQETIPRLEAQSEKVNRLLRELYQKKMNLDEKSAKIEKETQKLETLRSELQVLISSDPTSIENLFLNKLKIINDTELNLKKIVFSSESSAQDNLNLMESLKSERLEIENEKRIYTQKLTKINQDFAALSKSYENLILSLQRKEQECSLQKISSD